MYEYIHGGDIYTARNLTGKKDIIDFSANINPLGLPGGLRKAINDGIKECEKYPDPFCRKLVSALAVYENINEEYIFCANGASDIIFRLAPALKPKRALLLAPTFTDYEKALKTVGCETDYYLLSAENEFSISGDYIKRISPETDMVWICNPNNPTGQGCNKLFLYKVLDHCRQTNTVVLVDECFIDFMDHPEEYSVQSHIGSHNNLIILKAFTKIFAMPGIRLGYALTSNTEIIEKLRHSGQDWSVSALAQAAGISALQNKKYLQNTKELVSIERRFLQKELTELGFKIYGSMANYIFFHSPSFKNLDRMLLSKGILIRSCSNYAGLGSGYFRVAVRNNSDNLKLLVALKDITANES